MGIGMYNPVGTDVANAPLIVTPATVQVAADPLPPVGWINATTNLGLPLVL